MNRPTTPASLPYCAGISALDGLCKKHGQCAIYRKWWETPGTDAKKCESGKYDRFVPLASTAAAPVAVAALPVGKTLEMFA